MRERGMDDRVGRGRERLVFMEHSLLIEDKGSICRIDWLCVSVC